MSENPRKTVVGWPAFNRSFICIALLFVGFICWIWIEPSLAQLPDPATTKKQPAPPRAGSTSGGAGVTTAPTVASDTEVQLKLLKGEIESQRKQLEAERDRLTALDNISRVLLTTSGVFAVLLGIGAWKTLDDQRRSAEQQFGTLREELQKDFPMFGRIRRNLIRVIQSLQSACQGLQAQDDTLKDLSWEQKEEIMFLERAVADTVLLDMRDYSDLMVDVYRLLGVFYGSRYTLLLITGLVDAPRDYLDRSQYYFSRAIDAGESKNYLAYSHAGYFSMFYRDATLSRRAREYLLSASRCGPMKQRPLVNLALLELHAFCDAGAALRALAQTEGQKEFEEAGSPTQPRVIEYERACALALKADVACDAGERRALYLSALEELEKATAQPNEWIRGAFMDGDYQSLADRENFFRELSSQAELGTRFRAVEQRIASWRSAAGATTRRPYSV